MTRSRNPWRPASSARDDPPPVPPGVDPEVPSPARLYDYYLGGTINYPADQRAAERLRTDLPEISDMAWANRGFHQRAAKWLAEDRGISQFVDLGLKVLLDAECVSALLKYIEQAAPPDSAESMAARTDRLAAKMHRDVVPMVKIAKDRSVRFGVCRTEARHGLVREHDAPTEGVIGLVALVDLDGHAGQGFLQQYCAVQAGRTAADEHHSLHARTIEPDTLDVKYL